MNFVTSKDGTRIAYDKTGQGPALILIGGAFSYRNFPGTVQLAKLLAEHFTVFNYDRRGRGDSGDTKPYSTTREIEDLRAMIDDAAGGSAFVWGLSSGAVLALQAASEGVNIKKLALHEPPFVAGDVDHKPPKDFLEHVTGLIQDNRRSEAVKYFMTKGMGAPSFIITMMRMMPGVWAKLTGVAHTLPYDAALMDGYMGGKPLPARLFNSVMVPTAVLEGTESPAWLRSGAQSVAAALPDAKLISKKGLGHTKQLNATIIATELKDFFQ
ncbi:alpha/beta fold hydrolase [Paenibacillus dakarensis]|uniref:alpha/beta fold hydrolase n=1 Tax=Paenibacillus dakarensis TaxID=1527293 RepID=UPI0006D59182|nr:alpha/beta hydrolase [Paenibacillus dakarensis]